MKMRRAIPLKSWIRLLAGVGMVFLAPASASAGDIKVIANSSVKADTISPTEIKRIFLLEGTSLDDGTRVEPVLERSGYAHESFLKQFLDTNSDALRSYYGTLVFTGKGSMPKEFPSDSEVVRYVTRTRGAIGYVGADANTGDVKILAVINTGHADQRRLITDIEPNYPETLKLRGIGGMVRLQVTISAKGNVESVQLLGGNPILAESAISAVKQWIYFPSRSRSTIEVYIPFDARP